MAMVEPELCLFQMQIEGVPGHAIELHQSALGITPKALNAVDMNRASCKFIVAVVDSQMFVKANINQSVVTAPAVGVDDAGYVSLASNDGLQRAFGGIGHDLCVDALTTFEQAKYNGLAASAPTAKSAHAARTEVRLIGFKLTAQGRDFLALLGHAPSQAQVDRIDGTNRNTTEFGAVRGSQIHCKVAQDLTQFGFTEFGMPEIPIFLIHDRNLAHLLMSSAS